MTIARGPSEHGQRSQSEPIVPQGHRQMNAAIPETASNVRGHLLASLGILLVVAATQLVPSPGTNEWVYLLKPRAIADPDFLPHLFESSRDVVTAFWALGAGLFFLFEDPVLVAIVGRILGWAFVVYCLSKLIRELRLGWLAFLLGTSLWLLTGQSLMAGEWLFGGVEQKVFAYGFLFLALTALLGGNGIQAGLFSGLAIAFHILVGGWGAMALAVGAAASWKLLGRRNVLTFFLTSFALGLPFLVFAIRSQITPFDADTVMSAISDPTAFNVLFRNPHHLDPASFLTGRRLVKMLVLGGFVFFAISALRLGGKGRILAFFLGTTVAVFVLGLLARPAEFFPLLFVYPFRLADLLLPLFFWLFGIELAWRLARRGLGRQVELASRPRWSILFLCLFALGAGEMSRDLLPNLARDSQEVIAGWAAYWSGEMDSFDAMAHWIQENTEPEVTVAVPPCRGDFLIKAERDMVVNFKSGPYGNEVYDWYARLVALNGGKPISGVGYDVCAEIAENLSSLSRKNLVEVRDTYAADLFLSMRERTDLADHLMNAEGELYLYDLRSLTGG